MLNFSRFQKNLFVPLLLVLPLFLLSCSQNNAPNDKFVVGIININSGVKPMIESFKERLQMLSDLDNRTLDIIEPKGITAEGVDQALFDLKKQGVDLVFLSGTGPSRKAINIFKKSSTAILFAPVYDPVRSGLVGKLLHSESYITGVKVGGSNAKTLSFLLRANPKVKKVLVPLSGSNPVEAFSFADLTVAADKLDVELVVVTAQTKAELKARLDSIPSDIDAIWLMHSMFLAPNYKLFVEAAIKNKLLLASGTGLGKEGVMISYGQKFTRTSHQAARLANQIARGVPLKELPVETADFFLKINLKTTHAAGLEIPVALLRQAEKVYQ